MGIMEHPSLAALIGEIIALHIPSLNKEEAIEAKLLAIEQNGLWIEYMALAQAALEAANVKISPKTLAFFVPFSSISFVYGSVASPTLSETLLT